MLLSRVVALAFILTGTALFVAAVDAQLRADITCNASNPMHYMICIEAHEREPNPPPGGSGGCRTQYYYWCVPIEGSGCESVSGYGTAVSGSCRSYFDEVVQACASNTGVRPITVHHFQSTCAFYEGSCMCVWAVGGEPSETIPVCNCSEW